MSWIDAIVLISTLLFIVVYGSYKSRGNKNVNDFIKGGNEAKWWTVGLSVMATQASAVTFLSTPGQAFNEGMGFVQFYLGVPIAMIVICMVFLPIYHKLKVYTAYEYLESRFDKKTRILTALLFLIQRGLAAGITIFAPAIVLSAVIGWDLFTLNIIIGFLVIIYTVSGGTKAVNVTQKQQMAVIFAGMFIAFFFILNSLPEDISFNKALKIAGSSGKLDVLDFSFNFENRYTIWSGLLGGTFLALSYFGTDQSQVQRYLSAKSLKASQMGLLFNGFLKVPMQFFILLVGVMVFVFYQFEAAPLNFNPAAQKTVYASQYKTAYQQLETELQSIQQQKNLIASQFGSMASEDTKAIRQLQDEVASLNTTEFEIREQAKALINKADETIETNDKDYVFISFVLDFLPKGLVGLLLAVILSAAMSSTASELNALASTTTIDLFRRNIKSKKSERYYLNASKLFTLGWGLFAIAFACIAHLSDNLIQLVNIIGSIFYGNVLGIFLIAFFIPYVKSKSVFIGAVITQLVILVVWKIDLMPYLWLNIFGSVLVISISLALELFFRINQKEPHQ